MYARLLGLAPVLASCSLINAYDDVKTDGAGGAGGSTGTVDPTTSTGTTSAGGGSTGGGGEGGSMVPPLACTPGTASVVLDLATEPAGNRTMRDRGLAHQPFGNTVRVFYQSGQTLRGVDINTGGPSVQGTYFSMPNVADIVAAKEIGNDTVNVLVSQVTGNGLPLDLYTFNQQGLGSPLIEVISDGSILASSMTGVRGTFTQAGPEPQRIDLLLAGSNAGMHTVVYLRHVPGVINGPTLPIGGSTPFVDADDAMPQALLKTATGRIHAFIGSPGDPTSPGARHWEFPEDATDAGPPSTLGPPGTLMLDAVPGPTDFRLAMGSFQVMGLSLRLGDVTADQLTGLQLMDLNASLTIDNFADLPSTGRPQLKGDMFPIFGAKQNHTEIVLGLARVSDGAVRFYDDTFLSPTSGAEFGEFTALATDDPIITLGGTLYLLYAERWDKGMPSEHDKLMFLPVTCEPQP